MELGNSLGSLMVLELLTYTNDSELTHSLD
jgi:hypothetical protein